MSKIVSVAMLEAHGAVLPPIVFVCYTHHGGVALKAVKGLMHLSSKTDFFARDGRVHMVQIDRVGVEGISQESLWSWYRKATSLRRILRNRLGRLSIIAGHLQRTMSIRLSIELSWPCRKLLEWKVSLDSRCWYRKATSLRRILRGHLYRCSTIA